jgi:nitrogen fixation/metabolism regulation signal transduction histidine kinase
MKNFSNELFFQTALRGEEYISDVYFSSSRFPLLTIAEPVQKLNQVVGVLSAEIDLKSIWTLVDSITIGNTGFAFLLSAEGQVLAHRDKDKVFRREDFSQYEFFQELKTNRDNFITYIFQEEESILVYEEIPQLNWGVVVQQSQREAFTLARQMQSRVLYFTLLTVLIAVVLGILSMQRLTKPLLQLVQGVREYGSGNLEHKIEMKTQDELAELAQEFNSMASSLMKNQKKLQRMERLAALSRFASLVSHEIRNPLNSMNINMQILKRALLRPDISPERTIKYLDVISSEITRINDLVTNFLTIARPPELNLIRSDLHQVLDEVIIIQKAQARAEGVKIRRSYTPEKLTGMFDYNQLKQVFHNIIINAVEAIEDEGTLSIKSKIIKKETSDSEVEYSARIEFKDNGTGIPKEIINEVFEFYHTTKRTGSGLGLAIAKQIIEGHKGSIYIRSKVGEGTSVFIELPIDTPCVQEQNQPEENKELN